MYTQCPECLTIYKVDGAELAAAHGSVRCGHCAAVFDALRTLSLQLPPEPIERLDVHATLPAPPQLELPVFRPVPAQASLFAEAADRARAAERSSLPAFAKRRRRARQRRNGPWLAGCALLLLTLAGEIAWAEQARWIDDARARAWLDPLCAKLGCRLPLRHDAATLELLSRDIRPHPSVQGALIISATLRNDAAFAQAFPTVEITLSDLDEKRIAMRRFAPREYLGDARTIAAGLAPGASTALVFEVADPGKDAVAFEFKFE
ncbi:zinc-ribbon and DUF3426 domain-containing protein [Dokdonella fugitiva]|jgi:predicted Zn finger-like uncharacterized protein|uniref:Putative Zn finger-like uncharacterized protein n=1 Tax=Dokdonella fugitiva TaxID=328517 RepID=A0A4R2HX17_9GAMM|nr:zinc-ribbon and DUF3426 domain-containing protein [Dokdonella fugitiva]MBA8883740.1 putative Zn finger-like uncharacterized protein [Dokdonella fugitiva]TCO36123.1 putative Zn finger-like uncharacterized protein [Dokdonella fugitiva]